MRARTQAPSQGEVPQYKLTELSYIDDKLIPAGEAIYFEGVPGAHMAPLNDAARAQVKKHAPTKVDPIESLPVTAKEKQEV